MSKVRTFGPKYLYSGNSQVISPWMLLFCLAPFVNTAQAQMQDSAPAVETIVERMQEARTEKRQELRPYVVTRDYRMYGKDGQEVKAQVVADVSFVPPGEKTYEIREASGKGLGEKIVRQMLEGEVEISNESASDISPENYEFRLIREEILEGRSCYVLELKPRRKDTHLIEGVAWVDAESYLLHRTEGKPAKKPSWWVKNINFVMSYEDVDGMWMATQLEAVAEIRLLGKCRMTSVDVEYNIGEMAAVEPAREKFPVRRLTRPRRDLSNTMFSD